MVEPSGRLRCAVARFDTVQTLSASPCETPIVDDVAGTQTCTFTPTNDSAVFLDLPRQIVQQTGTGPPAYTRGPRTARR